MMIKPPKIVNAPWGFWVLLMLLWVRLKQNPNIQDFFESEPVKIYLVVEPHPSEKYKFVSWDYESPNIWKGIKKSMVPFTTKQMMIQW
jgi:hypothetical protein